MTTTKMNEGHSVMDKEIGYMWGKTFEHEYGNFESIE